MRASSGKLPEPAPPLIKECRMSVQSLYVNLPIADVGKTTAFFTQLGFAFNAQFSNDKACCLVVNEQIQIMLLSREFFGSFTPKPVTDAAHSTPAFMSLSVASRAEVDALMDKALTAGGVEHSAAKDHGFMYQRGFFDLDGHAWEIFYMDIAQFPGA
jgi:uncharacterized protein